MSIYKYKNPILEIFSFEEIEEIFKNTKKIQGYTCTEFIFKYFLFVYSLEAITEEVFKVYLEGEFLGELSAGEVLVIGAEGTFITSKEHCERFYEKCLVS